MGRQSVRQLSRAQLAALRAAWLKDKSASLEQNRICNQAPGVENEVSKKVCGTALCDEQPTHGLQCKHRRCASCISESLYFDFYNRNFCAFRCKNGRSKHVDKLADLVAKARVPKNQTGKGNQRCSGLDRGFNIFITCQAACPCEKQTH